MSAVGLSWTSFEVLETWEMGYFEGGNGLEQSFGFLDYNNRRKGCIRKCHVLSPFKNL